MKKILFFCACMALSYWGKGQEKVPQQVMEQIYEEVKTPYKYGLVIAPADNHHKMDCPTIFRAGDKWYMTYVCYNGRDGKDGRGYETWLAESDNLLEWTTLGRVLSYRDGSWDCNQRGGFPSLPDMEWGGSYELQQYKGKHWMTYIGGPTTGYESAPLSIGQAWTSGDITKAHEWESAAKPLLSSDDKDGQWFENLIEYKSTVYWDKSNRFGVPFVMFYNAGGRHPETQIKAERVGIALSKDMKKWKRYPGNPVFTHEVQGGITGDAHIQKIGDVYVMFYFSAFRNDRPYKAFNTFACSYDLVHWTDWNGADLIIPSKDYDNLFAHKSYVVKHDGIVYHFYCAVNKDNQRGIAVAVSKPMGRSAVRFPEPQRKSRRAEVALNKDWLTVANDTNAAAYTGFEQPDYKPSGWKQVDIPHNWDDYDGYRQLIHGNRHGYAWYRKSFRPDNYGPGKRYFLHFEGVGSYATVYLNGKKLGRYPGGRTTFTIDVTDQIRLAEENMLAVRADHPAMITDLPWVCGGCSAEWGFSEGSQPMGIFRPVTLEVTDEVRVEPFGVHVWNDENANADSAMIYIRTEIRNYGDRAQEVEVISKLNNEDGLKVFRFARQLTLAPGETKIIEEKGKVDRPKLWSAGRPYLYQLASVVKRGGKTTDEVTTPVGIRTVSWPVARKDGDQTFHLNGKPFFINGVCEYEHQFGQSHAFSDQQIASRVRQIKNAGFNAFRDAHQPHRLLYQKYWDEEGILLWTQFSAHIWYDTPAFRENFKQLLRQWVKERRNSPSVVMWGLQNESTLPADFARECSDIIREMDPTTGKQRIVTTCNGGDGTDWNVVQNWSGTYGGDPLKYSEELSRQWLNGEYGAWRSVDLHTEGEYEQKGVWSEDRMWQLMEMKIRQAEAVRDSCCGQFQWIYSSHDNPGRKQPDEGYRNLEKVGPFNYKGLVTPWEEPLDVYYMYRSNYVPAEKDPMVYIVSHTWPERNPNGQTVRVFSNCEEVELFNDVKSESLGRRNRRGIGTHFEWEKVSLHYNVLYAVGYVDGKPVAEDCIVLNRLAQAPHWEELYQDVQPLVKGMEGFHYIYRVNCGGDHYTDEFGQEWMADVALRQRDGCWGSYSWADRYEGLHPFLGSQRRTFDPIRGTRDWGLFGHFRFGRLELGYRFPLPDGTYRLELYFTEPWHGTGGAKDCEGLRVFDVAVNDSVYVDDLDIWAERGHDAAFKVVKNVKVEGGVLQLSFPEVKAGQAVISAIAIASANADILPAPPAHSEIGQLRGQNGREVERHSWLDLGKRVFDNEQICSLAPELFAATWFTCPGGTEWTMTLNHKGTVYIATGTEEIVEGFERTDLTVETDRRKMAVCRREGDAGDKISLKGINSDMLVMVTPFIKLQEEPNLRPEVRYEAEDAKVRGNFGKKLHRKQTGVCFKSGNRNSIEWNISTGLAAEYALRFRFMNISGQQKDVNVRLVAADGRVLKDDRMAVPVAGEKWRILNTTTGSFINAGHYRVIISAPDLDGIWFDALDVQ